jgi:hypothetical protein
VKTVRNGDGTYSNESDEDMDREEDYGSDNDYSDDKGVMSKVSSADQRIKDREFLTEFSKEYLKLLICKVEEELEICKNKKVKGATSKKQKEKA